MVFESSDWEMNHYLDLETGQVIVVDAEIQGIFSINRGLVRSRRFSAPKSALKCALRTDSPQVIEKIQFRDNWTIYTQDSTMPR
jgi:hypothetical protein